MLVVLAYWHGEMGHDEASRYMAMARLSLEYHRSKWGDRLRDALLVIANLSRVSGFQLQNHMRALLPTDNPEFPQMEREVGNTGVANYLPLSNQTWSGNEFEPTCSIAEWHSGMPDLTTTFPGFEWNSNFNGLGLWQMTEGAMDDALLAFERATAASYI